MCVFINLLLGSFRQVEHKVTNYKNPVLKISSATTASKEVISFQSVRKGEMGMDVKAIKGSPTLVSLP